MPIRQKGVSLQLRSKKSGDWLPANRTVVIFLQPVVYADAVKLVTAALSLYFNQVAPIFVVKGLETDRAFLLIKGLSKVLLPFFLDLV